MEEPEPEYLNRNGIADYLGLKRASVRDYLRRGDLPQPDIVWLGMPLWLVDTIDEWRKQWYVRKKNRPVMMRPIVPKPKRLPKTPKRAGATVPRGKDDKRTRRISSSVGASAPPAVGTVEEHLAKKVAAALRAEGHYCTSVDVMTLADVEDEDTLEHERRVLRRRILRQLRR